MRSRLMLHRMVERQLVVKAPAKDSEGQQHYERQCWIPASSFAVEGQQDGATTISDSASTKDRESVPMCFVGFILRPVIRLGVPGSSLFTATMRGYQARLESHRRERLRGYTHQTKGRDVAGEGATVPRNITEKPGHYGLRLARGLMSNF